MLRKGLDQPPGGPAWLQVCSEKVPEVGCSQAFWEPLGMWGQLKISGRSGSGQQGGVKVMLIGGCSSGNPWPSSATSGYIDCKVGNRRH